MLESMMQSAALSSELIGASYIIYIIIAATLAVFIARLIPRALDVARGARAAREKGIKLETMVRDLGALYEKTKEVEQLKTQFFANVSHELRTPLALILGPIEKMLDMEDLSPARRKELETVAHNARTLLRHVNDLLDVAKLEAGQLQPRYVATDLARIVRLTASHFELLARERHIQTTLDAPEALLAEVDPNKIQRVLLNLLSNAYKFTPARGRVRCVLRRNDDHATVEVSDSGPGIPAEKRELVFERFRQGEVGMSRRFGGTGLGLAIARDFVNLHQGQISVSDAPEGGALFRVELPLRAPANATVEESHSGAIEIPTLLRQAVDELRQDGTPAPVETSAGRPSILIVEDNRDMALFVAGALVAEHTVDVAYNGREGLIKAKASPPDLVLTDLMMPEMSGAELVSALAADPALKEVPVIVLTAQADPDVRIGLLRSGAHDYLIKPFSAEELRARVGIQVALKRARDVLRRELASQTRDIESLAVEAALRKQQLELALTSARIAHSQAERALRVKSDFLSLVSHELRTPITALMLSIDAFGYRGSNGMNGQQKSNLGRMLGVTQRLSELVDSLLEYSRVERGKVVVEPVDCLIGNIVAGVLDEYRGEAERKKISLVLEPGAGPSTLYNDARLVRLVLSNIIANAVKFTDQGEVRVDLGARDDRQFVRVRDTGPGIPSDELERIFEPFTHLEPLEGKHTPGFGLGLALVRQLLGALGGEIRVESQVGSGSTFTVFLGDLPRAATAPSAPVTLRA